MSPLYPSFSCRAFGKEGSLSVCGLRGRGRPNGFGTTAREEGVWLHVVEFGQISYIFQSLNRKPKAWEGPKYTHIAYCCGAESLETVPSSGYLELPGDVRQEKLERELPGGSRRHSTSEW